MQTDDVGSLVGGSYVAGQLATSLRAAAAHADPMLREKAELRAKRLLAVLENLVSGALRVGQRQPYRDTPTWITPEVMRGGFASGQDAAGGDWLPHETSLGSRVGAATTGGRTALNGYHLTREGLGELSKLIASRNYRVDVPEEAALPAVGWLLSRGEHVTAATLIEAIEPFFDRLRFFPRPAETPLAEPIVGIETPVLARSAHSFAEGLSKKAPSRNVEAMREHYEVWAPLTDAVVTLVLDTIVGDPPRFEGEGPTRRVTGGIPFEVFAPDFEERRSALLAGIAAARERHGRCQRVHRENELFGMLTAALAAWPGLDASGRRRWSARVRHRLAGFMTTRGVPGEVRHRALRAAQVVGPSHAEMAHVLSERLYALVRPDEGLTPEAATAATQPVTLAEQRETVGAGATMPANLVARLTAVKEAPLGTLLKHGVVSSGEVLAALLPQLTGPALATRFTDISARALYASTYRAFRRRRSLLLLGLQHQIQFAELPWVAALETCADADQLPAMEQMLRQVAAFAITSFPETVTPNKLVSELAALAKVVWPVVNVSQTVASKDAVPRLPLVEEVASDIFMGTFSVKYLRAAQLAVRLFQSFPGGSLYGRYYGIDGERVLAMDELEEQWGVRTCPAFDAYCLELAALPAGGNASARNGAVIEQASILTAHNLAALVEVLHLPALLAKRWQELAERSCVSVLDRLERRVIPESIHRLQRMRASKSLAFSWRQMIFYASCLEQPAQVSFAAKCKKLLAARTLTAQERFAPVLAGFERAVSGDVLPREASHRDVAGCRRLLGWTVETSFLMMGDRSKAVDDIC